MKYPALEEVEHATTEQLAEWYRFLPSPGMSAAERNPPPPMVLFNQILEIEKIVLGRIIARLDAEGGMTSKISRKIGWERPK